MDRQYLQVSTFTRDGEFYVIMKKDAWDAIVAHLQEIENIVAQGIGREARQVLVKSAPVTIAVEGGTS